MYNTIEILKSIKRERGRTKKEEILANNQNNTDLVKLLKFLLDPNVVTGISKRKVNKKIKDILPTNKVNDIFDVIEYLEENNTGRDEDIVVVQNFLNSVDERYVDIVKEILTKTFKIGVTAKTINKIYGKNTIPEFNVMLAESFDKHKSKVNGEFYITLKIDGIRAVARKEEGKIKFFTRQGKQIFGLNEIEKDVAKFPKDVVLDGELLLTDEDMSTNELFRATQKVVSSDGIKRGLKFIVFDMLSPKEFDDGQSINPYSFRHESLTRILSYMSDDLKYISAVPLLYHGEDKSVIPSIMKTVTEQGFEGLMLNVADGLYLTKRTTNLLKIKKFKTADLRCIAVEEGSGKNTGTLGAILVHYKGGITKVGSGFTDTQRRMFWSNPDLIVNKIVEVQYFEESINEKTKQPSLRFPVFLTIRDDKDEENID